MLIPFRFTKKIFLLVPFLLAGYWLLFSGVSKNEEDEQFVGANPTSHVFSLNVNDLNKKIKELFHDPIFKIRNPFPLKEQGLQIFFYEITDTRNYKEYGKLKKRNDIILVIDMWFSDVYRSYGNLVPVDGDFLLTLDGIGETKTKLTVKPLRMEALTPLFPSTHGMIPRRTKLESTSIEEYAIIYYVGKYLGVDMPDIKRPDDFKYLNKMEARE